MFNHVLGRSESVPQSLSSDHDPLFLFHRWRANPSDFYRGIYARLLPTRTEVDARIDAVRSVQDMTDDELLAVIQQNPAFISVAEAHAATQVGSGTRLEAVGAVHGTKDGLPRAVTLSKTTRRWPRDPAGLGAAVRRGNPDDAKG